MGEEILFLYKSIVWEQEKVPEGRKLKKKEGSSNTKNVCFRLVAKGFSKVEGVDFVEIFSLVVRYTSICVLLSIIAHFNL